MPDQGPPAQTKAPPRLTTRTKLKIAVAIIAVVIVAVLIFQNRQSVETNILWATIAMPRALLLVVMLAIGFALGAGAMWSYGRRG